MSLIKDKYGNEVTQERWTALENEIERLRTVMWLSASAPKPQPQTPTFTSNASDPRGIRNNNPGNIERTSVKWKGMAPDQSGDSRFIVFTAPQWGIRAMARILLGDWKEGQDTVAAIINEWAPPSENDTSAYARAVARAVGVDPYQSINIPDVLPEMLKAMILHENGKQPYSDDLIKLGIDLERSA